MRLVLAPDEIETEKSLKDTIKKYLDTVGHQFEDAFDRKQTSEHYVQIFEYVFDFLGLVVPLHHQRDRVDCDQK
jgi:hypothetical protein